MISTGSGAHREHSKIDKHPARLKPCLKSLEKALKPSTIPGSSIKIQKSFRSWVFETQQFRPLTFHYEKFSQQVRNFYPISAIGAWLDAPKLLDFWNIEIPYKTV